MECSTPSLPEIGSEGFWSFLFYMLYIFTCGRKYSRSEMKRKTNNSFSFRSLIRIFAWHFVKRIRWNT